MGTANAHFDADDDEAACRTEALALIAANLVRLRARAAHHGSRCLTSLLEGALVQACWDAGIGPSDTSDAAVAQWLADLLGAAEKHGAVDYGQPMGQVVPITIGTPIATDR